MPTNQASNLWSENRGTKQINVISTGLILFLARLISRWNFIVEKIFFLCTEKKNAHRTRLYQILCRQITKLLLLAMLRIFERRNKKERKKKLLSIIPLFCYSLLNYIDVKNIMSFLAAHLEVQMSSSSTSFWSGRKKFPSPTCSQAS